MLCYIHLRQVRLRYRVSLHDTVYTYLIRLSSFTSMSAASEFENPYYMAGYGWICLSLNMFGCYIILRYF